MILALTTEREPFGYGAWMHRDIRLDDELSKVIFVPWFGIQHRFRGARLATGERAAGVLYATMEQDATQHPDSGSSLPIILDCHADNQRGLAFWQARGFEWFETVETPSGRYRRMRR